MRRIYILTNASIARRTIPTLTRPTRKTLSVKFNSGFYLGADHHSGLGFWSIRLFADIPNIIAFLYPSVSM